METFLLFHLNLFFSSIEEKDRLKVIDDCYEPLIELVEENEIPIGIELSGMTLLEIRKLKPSFIKKLSYKIKEGFVELIGSGYSQLIGPLVPYEINDVNLSYGIEIYEKYLGTRPKICLVNEMTYSSSMTELMVKHGFDAFIMDRNNISKFRNDLKLDKNFPLLSLSKSKRFLPIIWSDTNVFQKFQQYIFNDISKKEYLSFIKQILKNDLIPIYSNDAEIFNFRPGRFNEERNINEDEWKKIFKLIKTLKDENIKFITPFDVFEKINKQNALKKYLVSEANPIPVKKQNKYNLSRWAVTGTDDLWLNTLCFKLYKKIMEFDVNLQTKYLKRLCYFWSSDFRTHITSERWRDLKRDIHLFAKEIEVNPKDEIKKSNSKMKAIEHNSSILKFDENHLFIGLENIKIKLNKRRGMAIEFLAFKKHKFSPCIGTIKQGAFENIDYAADFYSGNFVAELPLSREKITDLNPSSYKIYEDDGQLVLIAKIDTKYGVFKKIYKMGLKKQFFKIEYDFSRLKKLQGSVNAAIQTLNIDFRDKITGFSCKNGGKNFEDFSLQRNFNHSSPATFLVSSNSGLGATSGELIFKNNDKKLLNFSWDQGSCAVFPKLQNYNEGEKKLTRVFFSLQEMDDTNKIPKKISNFSLKINP